MDTQILSHDKVIEELNEVLQIDLDAVGAYTSAIDHLDDASIKQQLTEFRSDHERHIVDLKAIIRRLGGQPKEHADMQGAIRKGFTAIAGLVGTEAVLRAMLSNEKKTNQVYGKHVQKGFPPDILDVLRRNFGDEQRHYAWIESALQTRLWEHAPQPTP
jgi:uncharacterized protein (TIGR02284 family)